MSATFTEYIALVHLAYRERPEWRRGQAHFNLLAEVRPDIAEQVRGSTRDPFYDDYVLPGFYDFVYSKW